ncbi:RCC1 domain-containing protein, alpha-tubulin suppressor [Sanguibacter keddieii DSM 10542]|uniref:RCC1 domain-containing protein, alpha-tubulin suppressor n=1 Tax=Sanguibacter keddieii (strain ATCC 51767 / DSM 10542 / NCFB 3025 / ST-74) TaxID=446469 RepID=D1BB45_SANKS|nr:chromosome condensation regulator [Sanguibacter keddieii]ACZ20611.1 RCC1 domain-containing protein, alpha-tubulin suppressor [Sanguibacter keddieii DSM 10542]
MRLASVTVVILSLSLVASAAPAQVPGADPASQTHRDQGDAPTAGGDHGSQQRVAAGWNHSLLVDYHGRVHAWGANASGQLGDGTTGRSLVPVPVAVDGALAGVRVVQVAAGPEHSLALADDGAVYAWGSGTSGQLGHGSVEGSTVPVRVAGDLDGRRVVQVEAAGTDDASTSLAVVDDGTVYTWGRNLGGRAGHAVEDLVLTEPTALAGALEGHRAVRVAAGHVTGVALTADGRAFAWGSRVNGAVGDGLTSGVQLGPTPVVGGGALSGARLVDAGSGLRRTAVIDDDGRAYGWGAGDHGALGTGGTANAPTPVLADMEALDQLGIRPVQITSGQNFSVVLGADGRLAAWGNGTGGQLGNGASATSWHAVAVGTDGVLDGVEVVHVSAGQRHTVALGRDGQVYAWGQGLSGELGNGTGRGSNVPVVVGAPVPVSLEVLGRASSEAAPLLGGEGTAWSTVTVAVDDVPVGSARVGGDGRWLLRVPHVLALGDRAITASQGSDGSAATTEVGVVGHALTAWGAGADEGVLGELEDLRDRRVVQVAKNAVNVDFEVALTGDGAVLARGTDTHGQVAVPPDLDAGVVQVAAGETFALALTGEGTVVSWGDPSLAVPPALGGRRAVQVAAAARTAYALLDDGTVVAWGEDGDGQARVPDGVESVVQVAGGGRFAAAVTAGGLVRAWGAGEAGQLDVPTEVQGEAVAVEAGDDFVVARLQGDRVAVWGQGAQGQLTVPDEVQGRVEGVGAGLDVAMVTTAEEGVVAWGSHEHGLLDLPGAIELQRVVQVSAGRVRGLAVVDLVTVDSPADGALAWSGEPLVVDGRAAPDTVVTLSRALDDVDAEVSEVAVGSDGRWSHVVSERPDEGVHTVVVTSAAGAVHESSVVVSRAPDAVLQVTPRATYGGG